jgi:hypothetical protein
MNALVDGKVVGRILESGSRFDPPDLRVGEGGCCD